MCCMKAASLTVSGKVYVFLKCELFCGRSHLYQGNEFTGQYSSLGFLAVHWEEVDRFSSTGQHSASHACCLECRTGSV